MLLQIIFCLLILTLITCLFLKDKNKIKQLALISSSIILIFSIYIFVKFKFNTYYFQEISLFNLEINLFNFNLLFGLDGISIYFFLLTAFLIFLCILFSWNSFYLTEHIFYLLLFMGT